MNQPAREASQVVPARYYARLSELLALRGCDVHGMLARAGLDPDDLHGADAELPLRRVEDFVAIAWSECGRTDLPVDFGHSLKLSSHGMLGYGMLTSPTLDYAYRLVARYFRLIMPTFRILYRCTPKVAEIELRPAAPMSPTFLNFHIETIAVAWHRESRDLLQQPLPPCELQMSLPAPPHRSRYQELTESSVVFGWPMAPGFRFRLPLQAVTRSLPMADPAALRQAEARCKAMIDRVRAVGSIADWVRMVLRETGDDLPTLDELARSLNMSRQTLYRDLKAAGVSYRNLVKGARIERACQLLADGSASVSQVAFRLGYTDSSNFARAFARDTGMSPVAWRRRQGRSRSA